MRGRAVSQIQVDEALVRNANFFRDRLEVRDGLFIEPDGDLPFELCCVGVFSRSGEVVLFAHVAPLWTIIFGFPGNCLASRDNANDIAFAPVAVTDEQQSKRTAQAKKDKAVFVFGMIWIVNQLGALIDKDGFGFLKSHAVLLEICGSLPAVPLELQSAHAPSITTL